MLAAEETSIAKESDVLLKSRDSAVLPFKSLSDC